MKANVFLIAILLFSAQDLFGQITDTTVVVPISVEKELPVLKAKKKLSDSTEVWFSNGHFGWMKCNDPIENANRAKLAAEEFKVAYPDQYQAIAQDSPKILRIPHDDFVSMTPEKQAWILSKPEKFRILEPNEK